MNQKQWIHVEESAETNAARVRNLTIAVPAVAFVIPLLVGLVVGQVLVGLAVAIVAAALVARTVSSSARTVLSVGYDAVPADESEHARLYNVVEGLCVTSGDQRPRLCVVDASYPLAAAVIDADGESAIVVSAEFVRTMDRVEVEGVMAHLLWRLRVGNVSLVAHVAAVGSLLRRIGLGAVANRISSAFLSPDILVWADVLACQATRFPPALVSALEKCAASTGTVDIGVAGFVSFCLPDDAGDDRNRSLSVPSLGTGRSGIAERIAVLKEI